VEKRTFGEGQPALGKRAFYHDSLSFPPGWAELPYAASRTAA